MDREGESDRAGWVRRELAAWASAAAAGLERSARKSEAACDPTLVAWKRRRADELRRQAAQWTGRPFSEPKGAKRSAQAPRKVPTPAPHKH